MDFKEIYDRKRIDIETGLDMIKSNRRIVTGLGAMESRGLLENLHRIKDNVRNVTVYTCLNMDNYPWFMDNSMKDSFINTTMFFNAAQRKFPDKGLSTVTYFPTHLRNYGINIIEGGPVHIFWGMVSPMDKNGYMTLSLSAAYEKDVLEHADIVILEINENAPRTFGDTIVHITDADYIYENHYKLPELYPRPPEDVDKLIAEHIIELIPDGSTLQIGIGAIPNAMTHFLKEKKELGIHTEMLTEGIMELFMEGVITNKRKNFYKDKFVCTFALGTEKLYEFIHDNPSIEFLRVRKVNDPHFISKNDNMISINTALSVDLMGNVSSESLGTRQISGTGGQFDTHRGAVLSKNGKGIIALRSTVKNGKISTILPTHIPGSAYTLPRQDIDYVVTEYGAVQLRGKSIRERAKALISIAHPDFREELEEKAKELRLL